MLYQVLIFCEYDLHFGFVFSVAMGSMIGYVRFGMTRYGMKFYDTTRYDTTIPEWLLNHTPHPSIQSTYFKSAVSDTPAQKVARSYGGVKRSPKFINSIWIYLSGSGDDTKYCTLIVSIMNELIQNIHIPGSAWLLCVYTELFDFDSTSNSPYSLLSTTNTYFTL